MKKILRHGRKPEKLLRRFECSKCHCVFDCSQDEYYTDCDGNCVTVYSICPKCGGHSFPAEYGGLNHG